VVRRHAKAKRRDVWKKEWKRRIWDRWEEEETEGWRWRRRRDKRDGEKLEGN
jgi:hypothetical protein